MKEFSSNNWSWGATKIPLFHLWSKGLTCNTCKKKAWHLKYLWKCVLNIEVFHNSLTSRLSAQWKKKTPYLLRTCRWGRVASCQSSSHDVLICGSSFRHRQIIVELMVVLSCRLTMGYHFSCVSMQMWSRIYTNAQRVSHLGDVAGDLEAERKRKGDLRWIQVRKVGDKVDSL